MRTIKLRESQLRAYKVNLCLPKGGNSPFKTFVPTYQITSLKTIILMPIYININYVCSIDFNSILSMYSAVADPVSL
jgi:hypothetical protein